MASEAADVDEEHNEVIDIKEGKDTTDEAHKELFSLESILTVYIACGRTCTFCCFLKRVQFSQSSRNHRITMGYYMVTTRDIAGTVAGDYIE